MKRHANPKPTKAGLAHLRQVASEAYPDYILQFCSHGDLGGHRTPRDHTLAFRLMDRHGKYHSNIVWVMPQYLLSWTPEDVRRRVDQSNGK
ncbi:MAG: hypothetical protein Tsb009_35580 [Planctomycetaceae bacterium]